MRKPVLFSLVAVIVLLAGATGALYMQNQKTTAEWEKTKVAEETARTNYSETIEAIAEIQDSLNAISVGDPASMGQGSENLSSNQSQQALDRIGVLRASISRNRARIQQLEASMKVRGGKIAGLERMITRLKATVDEKETMISQLAANVDSLNNQVTGLVATVQQKDETIVAQDATIETKRRENATVYYTMGSKKSLTEAGVVVAEGGVLGLGKTLKPTGNPTGMGFTAIDTDNESVIRVPAEKVQIVSAQAPTSYTLTPIEGEKVTELRIVDPIEFRKVKQLVIITT